MFLDLASWTLGGVSGWAFSLFVVCSHFIRLIVSQINDEARGGRGRRRATRCGSLSPTRVGREPRASPSRRPERGAPGAGGGVHCSLVLYVVDSGEGARARRGGGARSRRARCVSASSLLSIGTRLTRHGESAVSSVARGAPGAWASGVWGVCHTDQTVSGQVRVFWKIIFFRYLFIFYYGLYFARAQLFTPSAPRFPARSTLSWAPRPLPDPRVVEDPLVRRLHSISFVTC